MSWLVGWSVGWLVGWLVGRLVGRLVRSVGCLLGWLKRRGFGIQVLLLSDQLTSTASHLRLSRPFEGGMRGGGFEPRIVQRPVAGERRNVIYRGVDHVFWGCLVSLGSRVRRDERKRKMKCRGLT